MIIFNLPAFSGARELLQPGDLEQTLVTVDETISKIHGEFISSSFRSGCWGCPHTVERMLNENLANFERITLNVTDYEAVLADVFRLGIVSGGVFDALIGRAAIVWMNALK